MENKNILNDSDLENVSGGEVVISKIHNNSNYKQYKVDAESVEALDNHTIDLLFNGLAFEANPQKVGPIFNEEGISYLTKRLRNNGIDYRIEE